MNESTYIYQLIDQEYRQTLDQRQQSELDLWLAKSAENLEEYKQIRKILTYSDRLIAMKKIPIGKDMNLVKNRMKFIGDRRSLIVMFQKVAAILIIPLLIYSLWSLSGVIQFGKSAFILKTTETTFGVRSQITLNDGTVVWLNSGSKLIYPDVFRGNRREVKLIGEAFFQVHSDKLHPFYVNLGDYKIKATGTRFNVSNYPDSHKSTTYLEHGVISLIKQRNSQEIQHGKLQIGELAVIDKIHKKCEIRKVDGEKYTSWMDGKLIFRKDQMKDVAERLGRWYNAEIIIKDESLNEYIFTATFEKESLEEALNLLSYSSCLSYEIIPSQKMDNSAFSRRKVIISKK